jgi:hypothetical protein
MEMTEFDYLTKEVQVAPVFFTNDDDMVAVDDGKGKLQIRFVPAHTCLIPAASDIVANPGHVSMRIVQYADLFKVHPSKNRAFVKVENLRYYKHQVIDDNGSYRIDVSPNRIEDDDKFERACARLRIDGYKDAGASGCHGHYFEKDVGYRVYESVYVFCGSGRTQNLGVQTRKKSV